MTDPLTGRPARPRVEGTGRLGGKLTTSAVTGTEMDSELRPAIVGSTGFLVASTAERASGFVVDDAVAGDEVDDLVRVCVDEVEIDPEDRLNRAAVPERLEPPQ